MVRELPKVGDEYVDGRRDVGTVSAVGMLGRFIVVQGEKDEAHILAIIHPEMPLDNPVPEGWTMQSVRIGGEDWASLLWFPPREFFYATFERQLEYAKAGLIESGLMRADNEEGVND